jgi:N-acetylneuraminate synthase
MSQTHTQVIPAYSSHDFGWMASALAVAAGAKMVEKHVKLGNTDWAHFDAVAVDLTTSEFADYVAKIREAEVIVGKEEKAVNSSEHHKYFKKQQC